METKVTGIPEPEEEWIHGHKVTWNGRFFSVRVSDNRESTSAPNLTQLRASVDRWREAKEQERREEAVKRAMKKNPILVPAIYGREIVQVRGRHSGDSHKMLITWDNGQKHQVPESSLYNVETDLEKLNALYDQHKLLTEQMEALSHSFYEVDRLEITAEIQYRRDTDDFAGMVNYDGVNFHHVTDSLPELEKALDRMLKEHVFPFAISKVEGEVRVLPSNDVNWGEVFKTREDAEAYLVLSNTREAVSAEVSEISIPFDYDIELQKVMDSGD